MDKCGICNKQLNQDTVDSKDCGGDCLECMAVVVGDLDCIKELVEGLKKEIVRLKLKPRSRSECKLAVAP